MSSLINILKRRSVSSIIFSCFIVLIATHPARAQNSYPATGDALIHGLTIGTGAGTNPFSYNTALGTFALYSNTGGTSNTAVGYSALFTNTGSSSTNGSANTGVGCYSLQYNTSGYNNTATGFGSLANTSSGWSNSAFGLYAATENTTGSSNVAVGQGAVEYNTTGNNNVGIGTSALFWNVGSANVAVGMNALGYTFNSSNAVAIGDSALMNNAASSNTAVGSKALLATTTGTGNTGLGFQVLYSNTNGGYNSALGTGALYFNTSGTSNTATGGYALYENTTGGSNTASGLYSLLFNSTGTGNAALGVEALVSNSTGSDNTAVGAYANVSNGALTNATAIGYNASVSASNKVVIGNSSVTSIGGYAGWSNFSDGRFKKNINRNVPGLVFINKLVPITYTLDIDGIETRRNQTTAAKHPAGASTPNPADDPVMRQAIKEKSAIVYTGFVAQDVDQAARSIGYDFSGVDRPKDPQQSFYGLRYSDFVVPLVKAVQELSVQNDSLQQANTQLTQHLDQLSQRLDQVEQTLGIKGPTGANTATLDLSSAKLFQNNPNPFNQTTLINYYLPLNAGPAYIQITGMNGETIKSIALNGSGPGQISLQTAQLASGTYIYSLVVNGTLIDTKKMVLTK